MNDRNYKYFYKTRFGTFEIEPDPDDNEKYILSIHKPVGEKEFLGRYKRPDLAAGDLRARATGFGPWDYQEEIPSYKTEDIGEWECKPINP